METIQRYDTTTVLPSLSVRSVLTSKKRNCHFKRKMEQAMIRITQEVVREMVGLDDPAFGRQFDRVCQVAVTVYKEYKTQMDRLVNMITVTDMETAVQTFSGVLDKLLADGRVNCGRVATILAFAGCLAHHCIRKEIILVSDVDRLAEAMGGHLATRLMNSQLSLEELESFCSQSGFFERLPWRSIAFTVFGLGAVAVLLSIQ